MWDEIFNEKDLESFLETVHFFHDSCIKEIRYISGAYVNEALSMYPINDRRELHVIIQTQWKSLSMIELEFSGLKAFRLFPIDEQYTCEILDSTMYFKDDCIYWYDCGGVSEADLENYAGTFVCASRLRWRPIAGCMGTAEFFPSVI